MNILRTLSFVIIIGVLFSCGNNSYKEENVNSNITQDNSIKNEKADVNNPKIAANFKKVSLKIDGMTCEIGCARTIQSKLSKAKGVKLAEVSFEKKTGIVEFDSSQISEKQIVDIVEGIAGGDLYEVKKVLKSE